MKVYLIFYENYDDGNEVIAVYKTNEDAEAALDKMLNEFVDSAPIRKEQHSYFKELWKKNYSINEWDVN
jgi:hypothetical protein